MKELIFTGIYICYSAFVSAHGVIESPASREQFCGVESKPHEVFSKLTHEQCRPIFTKADGNLDNSVYNFMSVLTHTTGRQGKTADNLPANVCGFDSESWGRGKTPWDQANDWPVNTISSGTQKFVWNIEWGSHFSDTEEFAFWITQPDFTFSKDQELNWSDFEEKPFCLLKYDDQNPAANADIVADKANRKFEVTCQVPARENRAVIYGEWGRNHFTFERFHSCVDVIIDGDSPAPATVGPATASPANVTPATANPVTVDNETPTPSTVNNSSATPTMSPVEDNTPTPSATKVHCR